MIIYKVSGLHFRVWVLRGRVDDVVYLSKEYIGQYLYYLCSYQSPYPRLLPSSTSFNQQ